jgi:hypothetical protein
VYTEAAAPAPLRLGGGQDAVRHAAAVLGRGGRIAQADHLVQLGRAIGSVLNAQVVRVVARQTDPL